MEEAAQGVISIVTANMTKAIRVISVQRGYDPREFALMAFGGAGPIHAAHLARELESPRIIVPPYPGVLCAMGLLLTDLATDYARTRLTPLDGAADIIAEEFAKLEEQALAWFAAEGVSGADRMLVRIIDMRYAGQNYELGVPVPADVSGAVLLARLKEGFEAEHRRMYGYIAEEEPVQLVTFRLQATGIVKKSDIASHPPAESDLEAAVIGSRAVYLPEIGGFTDCPLYRRDALGPGHAFDGPAVVEQMDSTTLVLPGQRARVDAYLNIVIEEAGG
jgi:N-methylhydantoinase A